MYYRILSKDLKRKKTMNIILLIFIILATMFISSSVNNLIVITSALDSYFTKAGLGDQIFLTINEENNDQAITEFLKENKNVDSWTRDENMFLVRDDIKLKNGNEFVMTNIALISSYYIKQQKFFDSSDRVITKINDGEIYLPIKVMEDNALKTGDVITIVNGEIRMQFTIKDNCKDALLGSSMMGTARLIISDHDYDKLKTGADLSFGSIYSVKTEKLEAYNKNFDKQGFNILVTCDQKLVSTTYIMDTMIAAILLVVSVCLILISFVILRFTIAFTLNEEFREIGIMKAIGIRSSKVRGLYISKYFAISVVGAIIGFISSIPFGEMFLKRVSKNMIVSSTGEALIINLICSVLIIAVVLLFCYRCTHQVNKFSPIDAIRNGSNGERYKRKGLISLSNSKLPATFFLSLNDILSGLRRYSVLIITFTLGVILIILPVNTINTLRGDGMISMLSMAASDVYMVNENNLADFREKGRDYVKEYLNQIKTDLSNKGISTSVYCETMFTYSVSYQDKSIKAFTKQGTNINADQYTYIDGQAPKYANEVALTYITADSIGANIGDTVKIKIGNTEQDFVVSAIYQSMNNLGKSMRFSEKATLDYSQAIGAAAVQVRYLDHPNSQVREKRKADIAEWYPKYEIYDGQEYIRNQIGDIAGQLEGIKRLIVIVIIIINMLVAVLMEKIFIAKEKGEIGVLKSIGFSNWAIIKWQAFRIGIILLISTVLGALLSNPLAQISTVQCFKIMGTSHVDFVIKPLEIYFMYPMLIFAVTMMASILTALQVRRITTRETNNIE
jgi:putative ABC transport system permease protein